MSYVSKQCYGKRKRQGRKRKLECQREVGMGAGGWGGCTGVGGVSLMEMVTHDKGRKLAVTGGGTFQALEVWGPRGWSTLCWFQAMWLPQGQLERRQREGPCGLSLTVAGGRFRVLSRGATWPDFDFKDFTVLLCSGSGKAVGVGAGLGWRSERSSLLDTWSLGCLVDTRGRCWVHDWRIHFLFLLSRIPTNVVA